jgi:hypothetical protein
MIAVSGAFFFVMVALLKLLCWFNLFGGGVKDLVSS